MGSSGMDPSDHFHDDAYLDDIERQVESRVAPPRGDFEYPSNLEWWWLTRKPTKDKKRATKTGKAFEGELNFTLRHKIYSSGGWISATILTEADEAEVKAAVAERLEQCGLKLIDLDFQGWSFGDQGQTYGIIVKVS